MNTLNFEIKEDACLYEFSIKAKVDGKDMLEQIGGEPAGCDPHHFLKQQSLIQGGDLLVGVCSCGEAGCGSTFVKVKLTSSGYEFWHRDKKIAEFAKDQYLQAVEDARSNTSWEDVGRTAERLIDELDFSLVETDTFKFQWASSRISNEHIVLSFLSNGTQVLERIGWNRQSAKQAVMLVRDWILERA